MADGAGLADILTAAGMAVSPQAMAARLEAMRDGGAVLVAVTWGPPSGVVAVHWHRSLFADAPVARITTLFVAGDERRRGIGRLLLKAASRAARAHGCDTMTVTSSDATVRAFCESTGFSPAGAAFERSLRKTVRA